jgi:hypothetical protein
MLLEATVIAGDLTDFIGVTLSMGVLTSAFGVSPLGTQEALSEWRALAFRTSCKLHLARG